MEKPIRVNIKKETKSLFNSSNRGFKNRNIPIEKTIMAKISKIKLKTLILKISPLKKLKNNLKNCVGATPSGRFFNRN